MSDVKIIRLTSGEEILCTVIEKTAVGYKVEDLSILIPTQNNSIGIVPWLPYAKTDKMVLKTEIITFVVDPVDELKNQYNSLFSRIITPSTSIVT